MTGKCQLKHALISVWDKEGLEPLLRALHGYGVKLYSTGGTAQFIEEKCQLPCTRIETLTDFPEILGGRVKTLHPKVFGGILARRESQADLSQVEEFGITLFDLVVVNLYPFSEHLNKSQEEQVQFVDIGGPSMLRAAAKNHQSIVSLSDPGDYALLLEELEKQEGATTLNFRKTLAAKIFQLTSQYDSQIAQSWGDSPFPPTLTLRPHSQLRYGENPHQKAIWCCSSKDAPWTQLQGKELSYNNLLDAESAVQIAQSFRTPAIAIVKHNNPCGVAVRGESLEKIFQNAMLGDSVSCFGGVVGSNREIDAETARAMAGVFLEVILAPKFSEEAKAILQVKKNLRLIEWPAPHFSAFEVRPAMGGLLAQTRDIADSDIHFELVTKTAVPKSMEEDLRFAWQVVAFVRSNAIVIAQNGQTLGIGAGQMSRVDAVELSLKKAGEALKENAVLASDAFFPFRDNIDLLKGTGVKAIIQPGGSQRDSEVIEACNEHGIAMVFTKKRHFRH